MKQFKLLLVVTGMLAIILNNHTWSVLQRDNGQTQIHQTMQCNGQGKNILNSSKTIAC